MNRVRWSHAAAFALFAAASTTAPVEAAHTPATFTPFERAALPALAAPATDPAALPKQIREFGKRPGMGLRWGANSKETRTVLAPDGTSRQKWYIIPARRGMCLLRMGAAGCVPFDAALQGRLYLQLIKPYGNSPESPLPPAGVPMPSRVVGVAPLGTTGVTASTKSGQTITGALRDGMFAISGADMTGVLLSRDPLAVPVVGGP
jgi:hypothetical protein